jgi:hypothetical protein
VASGARRFPGTSRKTSQKYRRPGYSLKPIHISTGGSGPQISARHKASARPARTRRTRAAARDPYANQYYSRSGSSRLCPIALSTA